MSHTLGIICQFGTAHLDDTCPEPGCSGQHGWTQIDCPDPVACETYAKGCSVCNPDPAPEPAEGGDPFSGLAPTDFKIRMTTRPPATLPPTQHTHAAEVPPEQP